MELVAGPDSNRLPKTLSATEIASACFNKVIDQDAATAGLVNVAYTPLDAWIILSVSMGARPPNQPHRGQRPEMANAPAA